MKDVWTRVAQFWVVAALATSLLLVSAFGSVSNAGEYPTRPVQLIVSYAAGGGTDQIARLVSAHLSKKWGQPVNVVNMPGGSSVVGTNAVVQAAPDGYTILAHSYANTTMAAVQSDAPYKLDDLAPLAQLVSYAMVITVGADSPWENAKELIASLKERPEAFKYASGGVASPGLFALVKLFKSQGIDMRRLGHVVFNGGAPAVAAVGGGHVTVAGQAIPESLSMIQAGKVRPLAVSSPERSALLPNVPTAGELGIPEFDVVAWVGFSAPAKTPVAVVNKWAEGVLDASKDPQILDKLRNIGAYVDYRNPAEFKKFWDEQFKRDRAIAEETGLKK